MFRGGLGLSGSTDKIAGGYERFDTDTPVRPQVELADAAEWREMRAWALRRPSRVELALIHRARNRSDLDRAVRRMRAQDAAKVRDLVRFLGQYGMPSADATTAVGTIVTERHRLRRAIADQHVTVKPRGDLGRRTRPRARTRGIRRTMRRSATRSAARGDPDDPEPGEAGLRLLLQGSPA